MAGGLLLILLTFEFVNEYPLLGLTRDVDKGFEVIETERRPVAARAGLILEWAGRRSSRRTDLSR